MSLELINRSPDLKRLRDAGYEIDVAAGYLVMKHVPYVTSKREVDYGTLVSALTLGGEKTTRPGTHVVFFVGEQPCHRNGQEIQQIKHQQQKKKLAEGLEVDRSFSNKPGSQGYPDYFEKMTTYAKIISGPAESLDATATAKTFIVETSNDESPFEYTDTATARAEIGAVSAKLEGHTIAIVGLGGTGSYILDLMAKTPVSEIHLFDRDRFLQHNAFRAPGAPSLDELRAAPYKVEYLKSIYSEMHQGIRAHAYNLDSDNVGVLGDMDFVFLCVDSGSSRSLLLKCLRERNKPFIDVGMGVEIVDQSLLGLLRLSTSTPSHRSGDRRIPVTDGDRDGLYANNIQIADLNSLSAALAVIRWKKLCGFYQDLEEEHFSAYAINVNQLESAEKSK